jgi:hypothetical protein
VEALVGQFVSNAVQQSLVGRGVSVKVTSTSSGGLLR